MWLLPIVMVHDSWHMIHDDTMLTYFCGGDTCTVTHTVIDLLKKGGLIANVNNANTNDEIATPFFLLEV